MKTTTIVTSIAFLFVGLMASNALAFHDGGVARCEGCHTMHNSKDNATMINGGTQFQGVSYLLQGSDQSSTCLNCHGAAQTASAPDPVTGEITYTGGATGYRVFTIGSPDGVPPSGYTPGGDFAYLGKTYTWSAHGRSSSSAGERHGHNIVAGDYGLVADGTLTSAPGGTYAAGQLGCTSCHDPHGKTRLHSDGSQTNNNTIGVLDEPIVESGSYGAEPTVGSAVGVYRLLGGNGYAPKSYAAVPFTAGAPIAVVPGGGSSSAYNRTEGTSDTRVAYGSGMSEWCANCHGDIHNNDTGAANTALIHPAGNGATLTADVLANYNAYVASGNLTGTVADSYSSLVPYEQGTTATRADLLAATATTTGAAATANVMCLSCHRAHASGFDNMTRWSNADAFITEGGAWPAAHGRTAEEEQASYYGRDASAFATFQRSLCNKCHAKD